MKRTKIRSIKGPGSEAAKWVGETVLLKGWIRSARIQKTFAFIDLNDGSMVAGMQCVADASLAGYNDIVEGLSTGAAVAITGIVKESPGKGQSVEVQATAIELLGTCDPSTYPLQKKRHSFEFLRTIAHLRPRTNTIGAITRLRSALAHATHCFFQDQGFYYLHTPIITASDCEGAGQMF
ncbi:MAG: asparagine--tRNA ligase, partial [Chlamydiia bacterium]|nr:asparagine--tRNA ligase [Chlamydiia bacterium]